MLQLQSLCKSFQGKTVADRVSFDTLSGCLTAVLGRSGSGKSTLLNMVAGLIAPDSGSVVLNNRKLDGLQPEKRHMAMMFQDLALLPHLNVWQNAALGLTLRGTDKAAAKARALSVLADLDLAEAAERQITHLSGGEQQRVALARALTAKPQALLLDEPFSSLDTGLRSQLQSLVRESVKQQQIPALLVTHDPTEACLMADQIVLLIDGVIKQSGTPTEVMTRPIDADAARLLGCLNVSVQYYVPPEAVRIEQPNGVLCRVLSVFRLPSHNRIHVMHPKFGELVCFAGSTEIEGLGSETRIDVNPTQVIAFQKNE